MAVTVFRVGTAAMRVGTGAAYLSAGPASPSDIALSANTVADNASSGTDIGTLSATDTDSSSFTWTIVSQPSGNPFALSGTNPAATIVLERSGTGTLTAGDKTVRIRADDGTSTPYEEDLTIAVSASGAAVLLTTLTFPNESASTQATNWVSLPFGVWLPEGALGASDWPQFKLTDGTTVCPATIWGKTTHPADGSWRFFGAMIRVPSSVAGSGTVDVRIYSGGSAPSASGLSTANLSTADWKMQITGSAGFTGTFTSALNTGVSDADDVVTYANGDAGMLLRIGQDFTNDSGGAAHGQLYGWHFVQVLKGASGFLGSRHLTRLALPWGDVSSPTPTRLSFAGTVKSSSTTIRTLSGHDATETPGSTIGLPHYGSIFSAGTNGRWDYVQGSGSAAADMTMGLPAVDKAYFRWSRLIGSLDATFSPNANSSIDYLPMGCANMQRDINTAGERDGIGLLPAWCVRDFMRQAGGNDERAVRANALVMGGFRTCGRRQSTKGFVPVRGGGTNYTGLGNSQPSWYMAAGSIAGFQSPTTQTSLWNVEWESSHQEQSCYYAYLRTAEPQFLDLLTEQAASLLSSNDAIGNATLLDGAVTSDSVFGSATGNRDLIYNGTTYYNPTTVRGSNAPRVAAWHMRTIAEAWAAIPDTSYYGTAEKTYFSDVMDSGVDCLNAFNAGQGSAWNDSGMYNFMNLSEPVSGHWMFGHLDKAITHWYELSGRSNAQTLFAHRAKFWARIAASADMGCATAHYIRLRDENNARVLDMQDNVSLLSNGSFSYSASTEVMTFGSGGDGNMDFSPTNGDLFAFDPTWLSSGAPFSATARKIYYAVQASGQTCKLSLTPGGSAIDFTSTGSGTAIYARLANFGNRWSFQNGTGPDLILPIVYGTIRYMVAAGATGLSAAQSGIEARFALSSTSFATNPKNNFAASY